jgi:glycosyltransferase involved in cell wall biosynthesis
MRACSDPPPSPTGCTERMRLLRVAVNAEQLLYRSPGGVGRYTAQLLTLLPAAYPDCEVRAFTARHDAAAVDAALAGRGVSEPVRAGVARQVLPRPLLYEAWHRLGRPKLHGLGEPDLIHAPSLAVPPSSGRPLVVTVHDAAPELFPEAFTPHGRRFHHAGLAAAARRAAAVIAVGQAAADEIVAHSPIPADLIRVVPNGVEPPPPDPAGDAATLARLGLAGRRYVFWNGSLEPRKGVGTLVAAMAELRRRRPDLEAETVLAGFEGWQNQSLVDPADVAGLGPSLHRLGQVSEADLWALYRGAALFAFPSRHEGFGLPVVEAMSQGVPVVASDIPVLAEVSGGAAVLVRPGPAEQWADAIEGLLDDDRARDAMAEAGRARSRVFSGAKWAAGTRAVYEQIVSLR